MNSINAKTRFLILATIVLVISVLVRLTYQQFYQSKNSLLDAFDARNTLQTALRGRGQIIAGDKVLAYSTPVEHGHGYQRHYPEKTAQIYSALTGYYSLWLGSSGLERSENVYLNGDAEFSGKQYYDFLSNRQPQGYSVNTTIDPVRQENFYRAMIEHCPPEHCEGSLIALDVHTGAVRSLISLPTYNPNLLSQLSLPRSIQEFRQLQYKGSPLINRATERGYSSLIPQRILLLSAYLQRGITLTQNLGAISIRKAAHCQISQKLTLQSLLTSNCEDVVQDIKRQLPNVDNFINITKTRFQELHLEQNFPLKTKPFTFNERPSWEIRSTDSPDAPQLSSVLESALLLESLVDNGRALGPYLLSSVQYPDLKIAQEFHPKNSHTVFSSYVSSSITHMMENRQKSPTPASIIKLTECHEDPPRDNNHRGNICWFLGTQEADHTVIAMVMHSTETLRGQMDQIIKLFNNQQKKPLQKKPQ